MKKIFSYKKIMVMLMALLIVSACDEKLTEINVNPNGIDPSNGNVNQLDACGAWAGCIKIPRSRDE
jgi:uncharacterized lipoprotein YajG